MPAQLLEGGRSVGVDFKNPNQGELPPVNLSVPHEIFVFPPLESRRPNSPDVSPSVARIFGREDVQRLLVPLREHDLEWKIRHGGAVAGMAEKMNEAARKEGLRHVPTSVGELTAAIHDIGCGEIDDPSLINAPRRLTDPEFRVVSEHADRGAKRVRHPVISSMVGRHHRYADFADTPLTPFSDPVEVSTQILVAGDIIQSMQDATDRPYLDVPFPEDEVFKEVRKKVPHLPERVVEAGMRAGAVVLGDSYREQIGRLAAAPQRELQLASR
jgi:hypothetical protein